MSVQTRLPALSGMALVLALTAVGLAPTAQAQAPALSATPALAAAVVAPPTKALPAALDAKTPYQGQVTCDPRTQPGVAAFAALMKAHYATGTQYTNRNCQSDISEHYDGRALDWMLNINNASQKAVADSVVAVSFTRRGGVGGGVGVSYIIWNKKMWREYAPERGWETYTGAVPHTDHVHFSFSWDGARGRTSWWTGTATTAVDVGPCRVYAGQFAPLYTVRRTTACPTSLPAAPASPYAVYVFGQRHAQIEVAQRILGVAVGQFGTATFDALVLWQRSKGVPVTGVLDKATWAKMIPTTPVPPPPAPAPAPWSVTPYTPYKAVVLQQGSQGAAVVVLQRGLKVSADGDFGPITRAALVTFQKQQGLTGDGVVTRPVWDGLEKRDHPLIAYRALSLSQGSTGAVVVIVQRALAVTADGEFGPITAAAVRAVQTRALLAATGVVSEWTWVAIEKQMVP